MTSLAIKMKTMKTMRGLETSFSLEAGLTLSKQVSLRGFGTVRPVLIKYNKFLKPSLF